MQAQKTLLKWYKANYRPLPWRETSDPYAIWISEVMLQQTTVTAVLPYYEKFLKIFPTIQHLAKAQIEEVFELWSGLGYYSRAQNLHKSAKEIAAKGFPKTHIELMGLPGFGPYTSRAVASFAFNQPVGVLDGNVIRFLSRYHGLKLEWWKPKEREILQKLADDWVLRFDSHMMNQALIEIGATICLPQSPKCLLCPLMKTCEGRTKNLTTKLPLKKPKRETEIWLWDVEIPKKNNRFGLTQEHQLPFLKNHWAWPGTATRVKSAPKKFDFKHAVTHHSIYVKIKTTERAKQKIKWCTKDEVKKLAPTSLVNKAFSHLY